METGRWTISELAEQSTQYLQEDGESNRIRWTPNGRQIRYYTTLGLLDKPFGGRGYGNTYDLKHLLQLLAIKQLQHQGMKLAEIQPMLAGLSTQRLCDLLGFNPQWVEQPEPLQENGGERAESDFWAVVPPLAPPPSHDEGELHTHLKLGPGATLVLSQAQLERLTPDQRQQLQEQMQAVWRHITE